MHQLIYLIGLIVVIMVIGQPRALTRPVVDVYQMRSDRLPQGARAAWLSTWPNDPPFTDAWTFVGRERYPSKWTLAEIHEKGFSYREIPSWLGTPGL
jgi:hypothetical protein